MFAAAAFVPAAPILVPELNGADADATDGLRTAALAVAGGLGASSQRWFAIGVDATAATVSLDAVGTFAGFGVDLAVGLSADAGGAADREMALPALITAWLRTIAAPRVSASVRTMRPGTAPDSCIDDGIALRAELDADPRPHGVLIVADGANTLTAKAPGGFVADAPEMQGRLDDALARGDRGYLAGLDPDECSDIGLTARPAWQVLAGLFASDPRPPECESCYVGAPFGVGYHVGMWRP